MSQRTWVATSRAVSDRATAKSFREAIEDYRLGLVPVAVPLALLSRHLRAAGTEWARSQTYLRPYPKEFGLRGLISKPRGERRAARHARRPAGEAEAHSGAELELSGG